MEHKHFSHPHALTFNQKPLKSETNCSGCKLSCSDTTSYACWECKFFLHPACFHATRSIDHPSHPSHTLTLIPYPTYPSGSFLCNSCNQPGFGFSFSCSKCNFDLHLHCTNSNFKSNLSPSSSSDQSKQKQIQHKSHPKHALNLLSPPPYHGTGEFICNACGENGKDSTFHCKICEFDLHEKCADLPESKSREDHEHALTLKYSVQLTEGSDNTYFICDVCFRNVNKDCWMYYCAKCDFGTHVNCVMAKARSKEEVALEQHLAAQVELMKIQNRVRLNAARADIIGSAFYGPRRYYY